MALTFCDTAARPGGVYYYVWYRQRGSSNAWVYSNALCVAPGEPTPAGLPAPPPVPTMAQIQQAFESLPFARPTVSIQPVGGKTLVNLPTFYEVKWNDPGLAPGETSAPVQLLSWSIEFKVGLTSYDVAFGDGTSSGPTTDPGGTYPNGGIRHSYKQSLAAAAVTAQTKLNGEFRVAGGPWQPLPGVADLPDEPVTTLEVLEARSQLVNN